VSTRDHQRIAVEVAPSFTQVGYLNRFLGLGDAAQRGVRPRTEQSSAPQLPQVSRRQRTVECSEAESISFAKPHCPVTGSAKLCCIRQHGLEHRLKLAGGTADYLENLRRRGLLLERFAQLVEQTCILDGDDGLGSKVLHQLDLFLREGADLLAVDGDR